MELDAGITERYGSNGRIRKGRPAAGEGQARLFDDLEVWLQAQLPRLSGKTKLAKAIRYALKPMPEARAYLGDGRLELDNNICERSIHPVAPGRKNCLFMGSVGGGEAAAIAHALIETAEMNNVDPEAWLTWVLERVADHRLTPSTNSCRGTGSPKTSKTRPDRTDTRVRGAFHFVTGSMLRDAHRLPPRIADKRGVHRSPKRYPRPQPARSPLARYWR